MTNKLGREFKKSIAPKTSDKIPALVGAIIGGKRTIDVVGRKGFIYVRLRNSTSEFVQAYNEVVQNTKYDVPVIIKREGNRYVVLSKDDQRYPTWNNQQASNDSVIVVQTPVTSILRHGQMHSFDYLSNQGGGDIAWIYSRQFMPLLVSPYSATSHNVYIVPHFVHDTTGHWKYIGGTGTASLLNYKPTTSGEVYFGLVVIDSESGNPSFIISSGTPAPVGISGSAQAAPYIPNLTSPTQIPLAGVKLETGTSTIGWDNLYDVRTFFGGTSAYVAPSGTVSPPSMVLITEDLTYQISGSNSHFDISAEANGLPMIYCNVRQRPSEITMDGNNMGFTLSFVPTIYDHLIVDYYISSDLMVFDDLGRIITDDVGNYVFA